MASLSDPRLRQLGRRLVAFYRPELLTAEEMALFKAYLRDKQSASDVPETEWMTFEKAEAALRDLRAAGGAEPRELDAKASFLCAWCAGGAQVGTPTLSVFGARYLASVARRKKKIPPYECRNCGGEGGSTIWMGYDSFALTASGRLGGHRKFAAGANRCRPIGQSRLSNCLARCKISGSRACAIKSDCTVSRTDSQLAIF